MCWLWAYFWTNKLDKKISSKIEDIMLFTSNRWPSKSNKVDISDNAIIYSNRLSIVDSSNFGDMPFTDKKNRFFLSFNWEIYNYEILKTKLNFKNFKSWNDTEVLFYGLIEYWEKFISELEWMFSFVFFDSLQWTIIAWRDHFWIKPFYYYFDSDLLLINSDIRSFAFLNDTINLSLDPKWLTSFINMRFIPSPITIFSQIKKMDPGTYIVTNINNLEYIPISYYNFDTELKYEKENNLVGDMRCYIESAVKNTITWDNNIGVLLSWWLDSSAVYHFAKKTSNSITPISCEYSIEENIINTKLDNSIIDSLICWEQSEISFAKKMTDIHEDTLEIIKIKESDIFEEFDEMIFVSGEPLASTDALWHYLLAKNLPKNIHSYLSWLWVDELMWWYIHLFLDSWDFINEIKSPTDFLKKFIWQPDQKMLTSLLSEKYAKEGYLEEIVEKKLSAFNAFDNEKEGINAHMMFEIFFDLPWWELAQADSLYMHFSKEIRPVFLEKWFSEFCLKLPSVFKYRSWHEKFLFKEALKWSLPDEIVNRKKLPSLWTPEWVFATKWFDFKFEKALENEFWVFDFTNIDNFNNNLDFKYRIVVLDTWLRKMNTEFSINLGY